MDNFNSWNDIYEYFSFKKYYVANLEIDSFLGSTKRYAVVHTKTGEKTNSGREIYEDNKLYYLRSNSGSYKLVDNPYN